MSNSSVVIVMHVYVFILFFFGSDPTTSTLESPDCKASDTAASPDISQAPSGGQEVLSRNQTSVADQTDSATLGQEAEEQPASCQAGEDASASQAPMAVVVNGAEEIMASGTVEAPQEMAAKGNDATCTVEAPDTTLDLPKFTPALLQALLQECKSRSSQRAASESKGVEKEEAPSQHSSASPEKPTPMDADTKQEEDQEMVCEDRFLSMGLDLRKQLLSFGYIALFFVFGMSAFLVLGITSDTLEALAICFCHIEPWRFKL